jgi:hypothetical protein
MPLQYDEYLVFHPKNAKNQTWRAVGLVGSQTRRSNDGKCIGGRASAAFEAAFQVEPRSLLRPGFTTISPGPSPMIVDGFTLRRPAGPYKWASHIGTAVPLGALRGVGLEADVLAEEERLPSAHLLAFGSTTTYASGLLLASAVRPA